MVLMDELWSILTLYSKIEVIEQFSIQSIRLKWIYGWIYEVEWKRSTLICNIKILVSHRFKYIVKQLYSHLRTHSFTPSLHPNLSTYSLLSMYLELPIFPDHVTPLNPNLLLHISHFLISRYLLKSRFQAIWEASFSSYIACFKL